MAKTIVVCGYGPGISQAVARKFGEEGFQVALVARSADKVVRGAAALTEAGISARGFSCDLAAPNAASRLIGEVRAALGPITVLHWNAYGHLAGDLLASDASELRSALELAVVALTTAVQAALPDLRSQPGAAVLVTGGGLSLDDPKVNAMAVQWRAMGLALAKAAQHKCVGLLHAQLKPEGIYVGEVMVQGLVKGSAYDRGNATLEPTAVAERFWDICRERGDAFASVS